MLSTPKTCLCRPSMNQWKAIKAYSETQVAISLNEVEDPELGDLLGQVDKVNERERDALKVFMRAILQQIQMGSLVKR